jgi:hypothetical protein
MKPLPFFPMLSIMLAGLLALLYVGIVVGPQVNASSEVLEKPAVETLVILPNKTGDSKLMKYTDPETGVTCYFIQNDTADFYSGLQCGQWKDLP